MGMKHAVLERHGPAGQGRARPGRAWLGMARLGVAWQGRPGTHSGPFYWWNLISVKTIISLWTRSAEHAILHWEGQHGGQPMKCSRPLTSPSPRSSSSGPRFHPREAAPPLRRDDRRLVARRGPRRLRALAEGEGGREVRLRPSPRPPAAGRARRARRGPPASGPELRRWARAILLDALPVLPAGSPPAHSVPTRRPGRLVRPPFGRLAGPGCGFFLGRLYTGASIYSPSPDGIVASRFEALVRDLEGRLRAPRLRRLGHARRPRAGRAHGAIRPGSTAGNWPSSSSRTSAPAGPCATWTPIATSPGHSRRRPPPRRRWRARSCPPAPLPTAPGPRGPCRFHRRAPARYSR